jgi:hypothetical protein
MRAPERSDASGERGRQARGSWRAFEAGWLPPACAALAALAVVLPGAGLYLAMGLGIFALATGLGAFRHRRAPRARLLGAGAAALGGLALALASLRYGLALAALSALTRLAG